MTTISDLTTEYLEDLATRHTPGKWHVRTLDGSIGTVDTDDGTSVAQAQQTKAARRPEDWNERRANTELIAAAPALLRECLELRARLKGHEAAAGHHPKEAAPARTAKEIATRTLDDILSDVRCIHGHDCVDYGNGEQVIEYAIKEAVLHEREKRKVEP